MSAWLRPVGAGLLLGAGWGVLARVWMRLISTQPDFSWTGTLMIVGLAAVAGAVLGVVRAARHARRRGWWRLAALPAMLLFLGPGIPLLPAFLLGGWAWGSRRPVALRVVVALPVLVVPILLARAADPIDRLLVPPVAFYGGIYLLSALLAAAGSVVLAPWPQRADRGQPVEASMA